MARFKLGFGFQDIRGSIGNYIYSITKTGVNTLRQKPQSVSNPSSPDQATIRCNLARYSKAWGDDLSVGQRTGWNDYALTKPGMGNRDGGVLTVIKGNSGDLSGINAYIMCNQLLKVCAMAGVDDAPLGLTPPTPPTSLAAAFAASKLTVTWTAPTVKKASAKCRIWIYHHKGLIHRQMVAAVVATQATYDIDVIKGAKGEDVSIADYPGDYSIQMDTVDTDGTKSGPSMTVTAEVT